MEGNAAHRRADDAIAEGYLRMSRNISSSQPADKEHAEEGRAVPAIDETPAPQSERKYGIIVFGATGVAGKRILVELACCAKGVQWAACGRDKAKVQQVLVDLGLAGVDILVADAKDPKSLQRTFGLGEVVINCTGPYRYLGLPVVEACIATSTHYVDVTGETEFIMKSELQNHNQAALSEVLVVHCCGFDSVPADEGVLFTTEQMGCTSFVESFMSFHTGSKGLKINSTTFEAAVIGMKEVQATRETRKQLLSARMACGREYQGPQLKVKDSYWEDRIKGMAIKFPVSKTRRKHNWEIRMVTRGVLRAVLREGKVRAGADSQVVKTAAIYRSHRTGEPETQYAAYLNVGSHWNAFRLGFHDQLVKATSSIAGVDAVLKNAEFLTAGLVKEGGPADDEMAETTFDITFYAMGWKDKLVGPTAKYEGFPTWQAVTKVSGPEPAYVATAIFATSAALTLILDKIVLPYKGGVLMPSEAFAGTRFRKRLMSRGIKFEVLSSERHIYSAEQATTATHWERDLAPRQANAWEEAMKRPFQVLSADNREKARRNAELASLGLQNPDAASATAPFPTNPQGQKQAGSAPAATPTQDAARQSQPFPQQASAPAAPASAAGASDKGGKAASAAGASEKAESKSGSPAPSVAKAQTNPEMAPPPPSAPPVAVGTE